MPLTEISDRQVPARTGVGAANAANAPAEICVKHLAKIYPIPFARLKAFLRRKTKPPVEALRDVSFDVRRGEIFGLIGRNGAGKTTLTKIVATLVQPTSGTVTVDVYDSVRDDVRVRMRVGFANAEERSFYWRLTAEQNLLFFARLYGMSTRAAKSRIADLFTQFELDDVARRRFGEISTGNKQRLAVARALLSKPPVLLLDEPTRSLDPLAASRTREIIKSLARQDPPVTILFTSHNLAEVETLCDRVAIISRGRIRALDTPRRLRSVTSDTERVRVVVAGLMREGIEEALPAALDSYEVNVEAGAFVVSFSRTAADQKLDLTLRALQQSGGTIIAVESEQATLLDALESYESEDEREATTT